MDITQYPIDKRGFLIDLMTEWFSSFGATLNSITTETDEVAFHYTYMGNPLVAYADRKLSENMVINDDPNWTSADYTPLLPLMTQVAEQTTIINGKPIFIWRPHQVGEGRRLAGMLLNKGLALLQHMPRTGKTGTSLYAGHLISIAIGRPVNVLISTTNNGLRGRGWRKGKPEEGWVGFINAYQAAGYTNLRMVITTPYRLDKVDANLGGTTITKPSMGKWDLVVVDESHKIFSTTDLPNTSKYDHMRMLAIGAMVVLVTATPHAQSLNQIYRQFGISVNSPFNREGLDTFAKYFAKYGIAKTVVVGGGVARPVFTEAKETELMPIIDDYRMTLFTTDIGYKEELMPIDKKHNVPLNEDETRWAKYLLSDSAILKVEVEDSEGNANDVMIIPMNDSHIPIMLHQIEGGTLKFIDEFSITDSATGLRLHGAKPITYNMMVSKGDTVPSKIAYIKEKWGDRKDVVIMYHYVNEGKLLRKHFRHATVLQAKTNAEAIDLYMYEHMVIYSMDWSVATYAQRRDRQVHLTKRTTPITVNYLCSNLTSSEVYESVVEKGEDLTYSHYRGKKRAQIKADYQAKLHEGLE